MANKGSFVQQAAAVKATKLPGMADAGQALFLAQQLIDGLDSRINALELATGTATSTDTGVDIIFNDVPITY